MNRVYAILRNLCWAFGADLAFLLVLAVGGVLQYKVPEWMFAGILWVGYFGGLLSLFVGTSIAVGMGLMRPVAKDDDRKPLVAFLGVGSLMFILLGFLMVYLQVHLIVPHAVRCNALRAVMSKDSQQVETNDDRGDAVSTVGDEKLSANVTYLAGQAERRQELRRRFVLRNAKDKATYGEVTFREIERIYQAYASSNEVETVELETLMEKYPDANRTGCAVMYAGQRAKLDGEKWFRLAIKKSSDCYYGDGVCVGAYARYCLACLCEQSGKSEEAKKLIAEIKSLYPDAVTHRGQLLAEIIKDK